MRATPLSAVFALYFTAFALAWPRFPSADPDCLPGSDCSTVVGMLPPVQSDSSYRAAITAQLTPDDRAAFEHLLGRVLATTAAVQWATREFARRMRRVVVGAAAVNGTSAREALLAAFDPPG